MNYEEKIPMKVKNQSVVLEVRDKNGFLKHKKLVEFRDGNKVEKDWRFYK